VTESLPQGSWIGANRPAGRGRGQAANNGTVSEMVIALCQLASAGLDAKANLGLALAAAAQAAENNADLVLLPELWQIGYSPCPDGKAARASWQAAALAREDSWVGRLAEAANRLGIAIVATFLERWPGMPRNTAMLIDRHGKAVLTYAKVHTCDFSMEAALTPGESFEVASLDTRIGPVRVGVMICYDREFPESARELMLGGAELVLVPNACEMSDDRLAQLRSRAFENMIAVALANYPAPQFNGRSCAFDGVVCEPDGRPRDQLLVQAGPEEGIFYASLDLDRLRRYREAETWADAYRKPGAYRRLAAAGPPLPEFARADSRRQPSEPTHLDDQLDAVLIGGREPLKVRIVDYDPNWPSRFLVERQRVLAALGALARRVEHIGSTAVPELASKPTIDILVEVDRPEDVSLYQPPLESAGYQLRVREPGHLMFRTPARDVHLHLWRFAGAEAGDYLVLRDWLRTHQDDRRLYERTKRSLAELDWPDMNYYAEAKGTVITEIMARARPLS